MCMTRITLKYLCMEGIALRYLPMQDATNIDCHRGIYLCMMEIIPRYLPVHDRSSTGVVFAYKRPTEA